MRGDVGGVMQNKEEEEGTKKCQNGNKTKTITKDEASTELK